LRVNREGTESGFDPMVIDIRRCPLARKIRAREFSGMMEIQDFGFTESEIISIETLPFKDDPGRDYFRVWYWR
jgi:hypothetical protein